jgi:hypothetical protein
MKHFFKLTILASVVTALIFGLSAFTSVKKANVDSYQISLVDKSTDGTNETWTWTVTNPNPGNGNNGTLQNVSHFDMALSAAAEGAMVSGEYSFDGIVWVSIPLEVVRDPSIRQCTNTDVLKFNAGTVGGQPTYYRLTLNQTFESNPYSTSWINSGSKTGCNMYYFAGVGTPKLD